MSFRRYEIPNGFKLLPTEISVHIFSFLGPKDLCNLAQVCKWLSHWTSVDELWKPHCERLMSCRAGHYEISCKWKRHFLHVLQSLRILGPEKIMRTTFEQVLQIKANTPPCNLGAYQSIFWEERVVSLFEHGRCLIRLDKEVYDGNLQESFPSFLHWAVTFGSALLVRWIVSRGGGIVFQKRGLDYNPLHLASYLGKVDIVEFLLKWAESDLHSQLLQLQVSNLQLLESPDQAPASPPSSLESFDSILELEDKQGKTALHLACAKGHTTVVRLLLQFGADANHKEVNSGFTPMHFAVVQGHLDILQVLLQYGANPNEVTNRGRTILHEAARTGQRKVIKFLVGALNMDVNKRTMDDGGLTPVHIAARHGQTKTVEQLEKLGADIFQPSLYGTTAVHEAANHGQTETVDFLRKLSRHGSTSNHSKLSSGSSSSRSSIISDGSRSVVIEDAGSCVVC